MITQFLPAPVVDGPVLLLHGGAWDIPDDVLADHRQRLLEALGRGRELLESGRPALDAVAVTISAMEASGVFDAGRGAVLTDAGTVELDAGIMDGPSLAFGSVAAVRRTVTPILAARRLLEDGQGRVSMLVGDAADDFADACGIECCEPEALIHPREYARFVRIRADPHYHTSHPFRPAPSGTVGCVARDRSGRLAAGTSTGGTPYRPVGRVGDSPLPGCGFYADLGGAASATGWGEAISSAMLAGRSVLAASSGQPADRAIRDALALMGARIRNQQAEPATGGLILLAEDGSGAWGFTTPRMARAGWSAGIDPWVLV